MNPMDKLLSDILNAPNNEAIDKILSEEVRRRYREIIRKEVEEEDDRILNGDGSAKPKGIINLSFKSKISQYFLDMWNKKEIL